MEYGARPFNARDAFFACSVTCADIGKPDFPQNIDHAPIVAHAVDLQIAPEFERHFRLHAEDFFLDAAWFVACVSLVEARLADLGVWELF